MQSPRFWYQPPQNQPLWAKALTPLAMLYEFATAKRVQKPAKVNVTPPVICVGNINAGGTGKTPTTIALVQFFQDHNMKAFVVSRGYGGAEQGPIEVAPNSHKARDVGDEPLLLAAFTRVFVAKNRTLGAKLAQKAGADVILLDDGHQNPDLHKDFSIVVVNAERGFGNGYVLPKGPLREPIDAGLKRADMVLSIGTDDAQSHFAERYKSKLTLPHLQAELNILQMGMDFKDLPVLAFAGIAHPEKFFETVRGLGARILHQEALADHQELTPGLMRRLESDAARFGAQLITTEKDAVRLPPAFRAQVLTIPVRLSFKNKSLLEAAFKRAGILKT